MDEVEMEITQALINEIRLLGSDCYLMELLVPGIAEKAKPGQFVELKTVPQGYFDPLLARPISIYKINKAAGTIALIFKVVGRGTTLLAGYQKGEILEVFGPIGNGFVIPEAVNAIALVAGGIGMPPLFSLAESERQRNYTLFYGARNQRDLIELHEWERLNVPVVIATDDGSLGYHGLITEPLLKQINAQKVQFIVACGPKPMLRAVQKIALENNIPGLLSLESHMACGVGACLGCTCNTKAGYKRVCVDGPVFGMDEVNFDD